MFRFWDTIIKEVLITLKPNIIVEIGADYGKNTTNLLDFSQKNNCKLFVIDTNFKFNIDKFKKEFGDTVEFISKTSLTSLHNINNIDIALIDGDHNYYTVLNELKIIFEKRNINHSPVVFIHDICWPYGKRDMYYDPDNIPIKYRHPYKKIGLMLNDNLDTNGINNHLFNAIKAEGSQNGVLTAIEDFIKDKPHIKFYSVPILHGLGILFNQNLIKKNAAFKNVIKVINPSKPVNNILKLAESYRLKSIIDLNQLIETNRELEGEVNKKNENNILLEESINYLNKQLLEKEDKYQKIISDLHNISKDISNYKADIAENSLIQSTQKTEIQNLKDALSKAEKKIITYKLAKQAQQKIIKEYQNDINKAKIQIEKQRQKSQVILVSISELNNKISNILKIASLFINDIQKSTNYYINLHHQFKAIFLEYNALRNSWRWKLGNRLVRLVEIILLRQKVTLAIDKIQTILVDIENNILQKIEFIKSKTSDYENSIDQYKKDIVINEPYTDFSQNFCFNTNNEFKIKPLINKDQEGITLIVLNKNGAHHLKNLFESFINSNQYKYFKFIIVDHNSTDKSTDLIKKFKKEIPIKLFEYKENFSFSFSNNRAAQFADTKYLFFINNDLIFTSDILSGLEQEYKSYINCGVLGIKLFYPNSKKSHQNAQHLGIRFYYDPMISHSKQFVNLEDHDTIGDLKYYYNDLSFFRPYNVIKEDSKEVTKFPAVTAAALFIKKEDFFKVGGFFESYQYGYEDVDLCLKLNKILGKHSYVSCLNSIIHVDSGTQKMDSNLIVRERRKSNISILKNRFGLLIKRSYLTDQLTQSKFFTNEKLNIGFTVTENKFGTKAGDYYTALELSIALEKQFGYHPIFLARNEKWYDVKDVDVVISLIDAYDFNQMYNIKPTLIKIIWARNWFDKWVQNPSFLNSDLYLCSSKVGADFFENYTHKPKIIFPIATNPDRFSSSKVVKKYKSDYCFTGNYWSVDRDIMNAIDPSKLPYQFKIFGNGWEKIRGLKKYSLGHLSYDKLASAYASTKIVIDDATQQSTKNWGSVNSRVFDALGIGKLVITNSNIGVDAIFKNKVPNYKNKEDFIHKLKYFLENNIERTKLAAELQKEILSYHTYNHRAITLNKVLSNFVLNCYKIAIKIPVPKVELKEMWGDYHFAVSMQKNLEIQGNSVRIDFLPNWYDYPSIQDDVIIVLRGLSKYIPNKEHINIMWNISHPDKISDDEYNLYDHICVASESYAHKLKTRLNVPVSTLLQCTDPDIFYNDFDSLTKHEILFVGNSRKKYRHIVENCINNDINISVFGGDWEEFIDKKFIKGVNIPNENLRKYYSSCKILLNDHWESMSENGFLSNRLFDGIACGALILSDKADGLEDVFEDGIATFNGSKDFKRKITALIQDPNKMSRKINLIRNTILREHTFENRINTILKIINQHPKSKIIHA